jgi:hypothetical protein
MQTAIWWRIVGEEACRRGALLGVDVEGEASP